MKIIEIRPGEGGDDAKAFAQELLGAYTRYLDRKGWNYRATVTDALVTIILERPLEGFINEAGGHRVQRIPKNEKRGRVHTSTVTVSVLTPNHGQNPLFDRRSENDFSYRWFSGTGKGGQRRNKVKSCLELTHVPTGISQVAHGRSRETNAEQAMTTLLAELDRRKTHSDHEATNAVRAAQVRSGMRGDKRRTYRFQDDAVEDHETGRRVSAKSFMRGDVESLWR